MCNESRPVRDGGAEFAFCLWKVEERRDKRNQEEEGSTMLLTLRGLSSRPSSHHLQPSKSTFRKVFRYLIKVESSRCRTSGLVSHIHTPSPDVAWPGFVAF